MFGENSYIYKAQSSIQNMDFLEVPDNQSLNNPHSLQRSFISTNSSLKKHIFIPTDPFSNKYSVVIRFALYQVKKDKDLPRTIQRVVRLEERNYMFRFTIFLKQGDPTVTIHCFKQK